MSALPGIDITRLAVPVTKRDHIRGRFDAAATLLEYGDYECPVCGQARFLVEALRHALGSGMRFVFRNFPLTNIHPHAEHAAEAAEAAGAEGKFWEMHDTLLANQMALEDEDLARYAAELGLDLERFINELLEGKYAKRVREDFRSGVRSGVNGTPTFFVNDWRYDGPRDPESMAAALLETAARTAPQ
jgi:protein-disulfide isomerase